MKAQRYASFRCLSFFFLPGLSWRKIPLSVRSRLGAPINRNRTSSSVTSGPSNRPASILPKAQSPPTQQAPQRGGAVRGTAGGALVGLGIRAITVNTGRGAAIGAGADALAGGAAQAGRNQQREVGNQQAQANQTANIQQYNRAKAVCMERRGYTVK
jgi:hypothetical protein